MHFIKIYISLSTTHHKELNLIHIQKKLLYYREVRRERLHFTQIECDLNASQCYKLLNILKSQFKTQQTVSH